MKIPEAQQYLQEMKADGWLLYDFAKNNCLMYQVLGFPEDRVFRRRFFYWIPAFGEPVKIVHAIEPHALDGWPGEKRVYSSWQTLHAELASLLRGKKRVAMEYSPDNAIPYVSKVDGGTIDLVRSFGAEVVSSGGFLPHFTAVLDEKQAESLVHAGKVLDAIAQDAWDWIALHLQQGKKIGEYEVQQKISQDFHEQGMVTEGAPIVCVNANSADPHYDVAKATSQEIRRGDFILIDLWCKEKTPAAVFGDITRVGVAAEKPTAKQQEIFQIVRKAQKAATDFVIRRFQERKQVLGFEIDDIARHVITQAGYGKQFLHRTGHNIGVELHGSGAHIDNLEMHDVRPILPGTCFSIEPGIYLEGEFGVRLEYDLYVDKKGHVQIVGGVQEKIVCLF